MKDKALILILLIVPVIMTAFNLRIPAGINDVTNQSGLLNNQHSISIPALNADRSRTWRLDEMEYWTDQEATGTMVQNDHYAYFYNEDLPTRVDSIQVYWFDQGTNSWVHNYTRILDYDQTGEYITTEYFKNWNNYVPFMRIECSYDNQHRLTNIYQYNFEWDLMEYYLTERTAFEYGTNCLNQMMIINPSIPVRDRSYYERYTFDNDEQGRIMTAYGYAGPDSINWEVLSLEELGYRADDTSTGPEYISYLSHYILIDEDWEDGFYGKFEYKDSFYNYTGVAWNDFYHDTYTYNPAGQLIEILNQYMNVTFQNVGRYTFTYDPDNNLYLRFTQDWIADPPSWETAYEAWSYEWGQTSANDDNVLPLPCITLSTWPNPFTDAVSIRLESKSNTPVRTSVYNIKGQLVKSLEGTGKLINWDGKDKNNQPVSNGIYVVRAVHAGKSVSQKVIRIK